MALEHVESRLPFACQTPTLDQQLPLDSSVEVRYIKSLYNSGRHIPISFELNTESSTLGPYSRSAQATYLLDQVLNHIIDEKANQESKRRNADKIDQSLQSLLLSMLRPVGFPRGDYCGPYSTCMSALMCLHQHQLSSRQRLSQAPDTDSLSRATLAVDSASRMILQATVMSQEQPRLDWDVMPFWTVTCLYITALARIKLGGNGSRLVEEIGAARDYLRHFKSRWRIAGKLSKLEILI